MSAIPRQPEPRGFAGLRLSAEEFIALGETTDNIELVHGVVVMSPRPFPIHQRLVHEIQYQLESARRAGLQIVVFPDTDIQLAPDLVYRPDISVYSTTKMPGVPRRLVTPPDLAIEVVSLASKGLDLVTKRDDYERLGVGEYWAIDPEPQSISSAQLLRVRAFRRHGLSFSELITHDAAPPDTIESAALPGLRLDICPLREMLG